MAAAKRPFNERRWRRGRDKGRWRDPGLVYRPYNELNLG
jgi:hypothetical protein